jgi:UDP-galactopyranose mutase
MPADLPGIDRPEIVFWSDFPLGYHNREAEEKMARFAARGYPVLYVEKVGIRNPRLRHVPRMIAALVGRRGNGSASGPLRAISPKLAFPRRAPLVQRMNARLLERQVASSVRDAAGSVFWIRYPSPELPPLLDSVGPRLVVYEAVDDHERGPGITPALKPLLKAAEEAILARATVVFAWSEPLRDRLTASHSNVVLAGAAADLERFSAIAGRQGEERLAAWAGAVDFRCDADLLVEVAERLAEWTFLIAGPVVERRARRLLASTPNLELLGTVPHARIPSLIARARVCLMPYRRSEVTETLFPIKLVEYLAAGRPVVSSPIRIAREFSDVVATAADPDEFATAIERCAVSDSPEARAGRQARAAPYSWDARIDQMETTLQEALANG